MENLEPVLKLTKDIKNASYTLSKDEARFLVDAYYTMQDNRIRSANQIRSMNQSGEPNEVLKWLLQQNENLEKQVAKALDAYSASKEIGKWTRSICGIGPVITAGLMAHIDITKCEAAGNLWSYAGLSPLSKWEKGEKRPWNAELKKLCWKLGESFVKVSINEKDIYGKIYIERKKIEQEMNERLEFSSQAEQKLKIFKIGKDTDAYKAYSQGKLPPAHIHARAKRYAVKMFLSHFWETWRKLEGLPAPVPYAIAQLGHAHKIEPHQL